MSRAPRAGWIRTCLYTVAGFAVERAQRKIARTSGIPAISWYADHHGRTTSSRQSCRVPPLVRCASRQPLWIGVPVCGPRVRRRFCRWPVQPGSGPDVTGRERGTERWAANFFSLGRAGRRSRRRRRSVAIGPPTSVRACRPSLVRVESAMRVSINPVVLLDEIDKSSSDYLGANPVRRALACEVFDPCRRTTRSATLTCIWTLTTCLTFVFPGDGQT